MDDAALLRAFSEHHDEAAFRTLVARHADLVHSAALRRVHGDPHRAHDVSQRVFIALARKARSLSGHPALAAWLHQATRLASAELLRSEGRRRHYETTAADDPALTAGMSASETSAAEWASVQPVLDEALDALSEKDRTALILRFLEHRSFAAVGAQLGLAENAARMRVERALDKLRARLVRHGVTSSAAALGVALAQQGVSAAPAAAAGQFATAALAGSTAATAGAGLLSSLLLMTKVQLGLATTVTLLAAAGYFWQRQQTEQLALALEAEQSRLADLRTETSRLRNELAHRSAQAAARRASQAPIPGVAPLTPAQLERRQLDLIVRKAELDQTYLRLFQKLRLPATTLERFKLLLVERDQARYDAERWAEDAKLSFFSYHELQEYLQAVTADIDRRVQTVLGPGGYAEFQEFLSLDPYIRNVDRVGIGEFGYAPTTASNVATGRLGRLQDTHEMLARIWRDLRPEASEEFFQGNGWPVPVPEEVIAEVRKSGQVVLVDQLQRHNRWRAAQTQLLQLAAVAAEQGKLELHKESEPFYPTPNFK